MKASVAFSIICIHISSTKASKYLNLKFFNLEDKLIRTLIKRYYFIRQFTSTQGHADAAVHWNPQTGYQTELPRYYYPRKAGGKFLKSFSQILILKFTTGPGVTNGFSIVLNAQIDDYFCSSTNGAGFKVNILNNRSVLNVS